jgi:hypothetical protein
VRITTTGSCSTVHCDSLPPWDASLASLILSQPRTVPHPRELFPALLLTCHIDSDLIFRLRWVSTLSCVL